MKAAFIVVSCLLISTSGFGQLFIAPFGAVADTDMDMVSYGPEPDAEAIVLFDVGESAFVDTPEHGYNIHFTRTRRVKILTRAGIDWATVSIPFYVEKPERSEKVVSLQAFTYNREDGRTFRKPLDPSTVFEEQINNRWRAKKFVFPDVKEGSVIEYRYTVETPFHFNLPDWNFQGNIPAVYSEYTVRMIPFYEYVYLAQGITKFDHQSSQVSTEKRVWGTLTKIDMGNTVGEGVEFSDYVHTYAMKNVPAFKDESFITSEEDYIMKIDFQLSKFNRPQGGSEEIITTWPLLIKRLMKHEKFGKYMNSSERFARKILENELQLSDMTPEKKCEAIVKYVRSNFRWDEYNSNYASKSAKEFVEQKTGNSADINLFLTAMLKEAGIGAEPVIISTRNNGKIQSNYPFEHYFNTVVIFVGGERPFLTDGTENLVGYNRIPLRCINEKGLVVSETEEKWVNLESRFLSIDDKVLYVKIDPEQATAQIACTIQTTEYEAMNYKARYANDSAKIKKRFLERHSLDVVSVKAFNYDNSSRPYVIILKGTAPVEVLGDKLVINPLLSFPMKENPLKQPTRSYPVDFIYPQADQTKATIAIPKEYTMINKPEDLTAENDLISIKLSYQLVNNDLNITANYTLKKAVYPTVDYAKLKSFFDLIVKQFNQQIVLQKKA
jgi:hypothetical protein